MNETMVTVVGNVATAPVFRELPSGSVARFRLAATARHRDRGTGAWADGHTNFFTVWAWRGLGANVAASLSVGEPVIVQGRLKVRNEERGGGQQWMSADIDAAVVGHDLSRGTAAFRRAPRLDRAPGAQQPWAAAQPPPSAQAAGFLTAPEAVGPEEIGKTENSGKPAEVAMPAGHEGALRNEGLMQHGNPVQHENPVEKVEKETPEGDGPLTPDGPLMNDRPLTPDGPLMNDRPLTPDGPLMNDRPLTQEGPLTKDGPPTTNGRFMESENPAETEIPPLRSTRGPGTRDTGTPRASTLRTGTPRSTQQPLDPLPVT